jgi:hypothetical protein
VRDLPAVGPYAGRVGTVLDVSFSGYQVKFDDNVSGTHAHVAFRPNELEPEASGTP